MGRFVIKRSRDGAFRWVLTVSNGQVIMVSEGYTTKRNAINGIDSVRKHGFKEKNFEKLTARNGQFYFNLKSSNGRTIGSSEMYASEAARDNGIMSVMKNVDSPVVDESTPQLDIIDGDACCYCSRRFIGGIKKTDDHLIPLSKGGVNNSYNKLPCCKSCNSDKGSLLPKEYLNKLQQQQKTPNLHKMFRYDLSVRINNARRVAEYVRHAEVMVYKVKTKKKK